MTGLINKVQSAIQVMQSNVLQQPLSHILIGVSGGADSVALLHAMLNIKHQASNIKHQLSVAHLNHGIRPEAADDAHFVETLCNNLNIPFYTATVDVPALAASNGISLEMAARDARYKFFAEISLQCGADAVATAHNRDDQAETLLLKLCRGAGSTGLNGISPSTTIQDFRVIRPMLDVSRDEVEDFLKSQNLTWREDATNTDIKIKRNFIRHKILPQLEEHLNPRIKEALARTTSILREDNAYMEHQAATALKKSEVRIQESEAGGQRSEHKRTSNIQHSTSNIESGTPKHPHPSAVKPPEHPAEHKHPHPSNPVHPVNPCEFHPENPPPPSIRGPLCIRGISSPENPAHPFPLKIESLRTLPKAILRRTLRQWLINAKTPADKMRFDTIERTIELILSEKGTGSITLTTNTEITREYDLLHIINSAKPENPIPNTELTIPGETVIQSHGIIITATLRTGFERIPSGQVGKLPAEAVIRWDNATPPAITVRSPLPGDRIQPLGMKGTCKLKELFINKKISKADRQNIPIFICNNEIIWIPGHRISRNLAVTDQQQPSLQLTIAKILI